MVLAKSLPVIHHLLTRQFATLASQHIHLTISIVEFGGSWIKREHYLLTWGVSRATACLAEKHKGFLVGGKIWCESTLIANSCRQATVF